MAPHGSEQEKLLGEVSKDNYGSSSAMLPSKRRTSCCSDHECGSSAPSKKSCCAQHDHDHNHDHHHHHEKGHEHKHSPPTSPVLPKKKVCCDCRDQSHDHNHASSSATAKKSSCCGSHDHSHDHNHGLSMDPSDKKVCCGGHDHSHDHNHAPSSPLLATTKKSCCNDHNHNQDHGSASSCSLDTPLLAPTTKMDPSVDSSIVRSTILCKGICCSSEVPELMEILTPVNGIAEVKVNVPLKQILIDHDVGVISATKIVDILEEELFPSTVERDGGATLPNVVRSTFETKGICCSSEVPFILEILNPQQGIVEVKVVVPVKQVVVDHDCKVISAAKIAALLSEEEFATTVQRDGGNIWDSSERSDQDYSLKDQEQVLEGIRPAIAIAGVFWMISMISKFGESFHYLSYFGLVSVVFGIPPIATKAFKAASRGIMDTNVLMFLAVVGAILLKEFEEAAAVAFLFSVSEWLETRASFRANQALKSIVNLKPEGANLINPETKELMVVPATSVPVGSLVAVKSGDKIPCDGVVVEGNSTLDESSLTGESRPVKKGPNDEVSGGTVNSGNTQIVVRTTRTSDNSAVSRLIRLVEEAQANRSETEKIVDSFAKVYTPIVVIGALAMCTIPWYWGAEVGRSYMSRGLSLVVIACPCALVISTPVSYVAGLAATAQNGVLVKGGAHLEALGQLKHVCFDKTGTLTMGEFKLLKLIAFGAKNKREEVLQYLALMEDRATHPLAKSLVDGIKAEGIAIPTSLSVEDHTFLPGEGVEGFINGKKVYVGNERLFRRLGMFESMLGTQRQEVESWEGTIGFTSIEGEGIVGAYCVADAPRPESAEVIQELKTMGMKVQMLTGDKIDTALSIGQKIGMNESDITSELLPTEKLQLISELKTDTSNSNPLLSLFFAKPRLVLMCGDGVNDAPSLVVANVGVAMGEGAALAMETADVTLMDSNLTKLSYSIKMGKRVIQKIRENVVFSIVVKVAVLWLTLTNRVGLWAAIGSDVGSMIVVTLNGMALLPKKENKVEVVA